MLLPLENPFATVGADQFTAMLGLYSRGTYAHIWTSALSSAAQAPFTNVFTTFISPGIYDYNRHLGVSLRCLFP
jgi:hypothetical protein